MDKQQKGFTLIESIVYISILTIIVLVVSSFFLWINKSSIKTEAINNNSQGADNIMKRITYEIQSAKSIYLLNSVLENDLGQISLKTNNSISSGEDFGFIDFFICNEDRICMKKDGKNSIFLSPENISVRKLRFELSENNKLEPAITIELETEYNEFSKKFEYRDNLTLKTTASLRNY